MLQKANDEPLSAALLDIRTPAGPALIKPVKQDIFIKAILTAAGR